MAYEVNRFLDTTLSVSDTGKITINDDGLNNETSLALIGKYYVGYGETVAQNSVSLLENFASDTAPTNPIEGQLWWEPSAKILNVRHAQEWMGIDANSVVTLRDDTQAAGQGTHKVVVERANGYPVSIISDEQFVMNAAEPIHDKFLDGGTGSITTIKTGINLNTVTAKAMKFHGTATTAQYADIAELYTSDEEYEAGTVLIMNLQNSGDEQGTDKEYEVTQCTHELDPGQIGVVTTDPALLMNSALEGTTVGVALLGRVPVKVTGQVSKGDRMVTAEKHGHAQSEFYVGDFNYRHVIGRALENKQTTGPGIIEVIVGVK